MHHDTPLISTIVAGLVLAFIFGMIANRFRMPPLVGYLFAGILVGPNTPGFVADQALGAELAELGVILLMFGVGLHFSLKDLMSVRALAIPGALVQIGFATLLGLGLGLVLGWSIGAGLLFGLALSVASTVVLLKALQDRRLIETERGRIAVGWLIVEDLAMVLALVLIPAIASLNGTDSGIHDPFVSFVERVLRTEVGIWGVLFLTLVKVAAFVGFMLIVGRRLIPWALHATAHTGSRELFRLAVLAIALGVALGSAVLFGVSLALGAFFAGMILSESELSHRAAQETLPLRDAFAVLFFVSVGMLFDPSIIITNPLPVLATVFIILIGKSAAAFGIVLLFRRPVGTALTISASLAQIGEFSFILASMGVALAILPPEGQDLILAGALISIVLNPVVFWGADLLKPAFEAQFGRRTLREDDIRIEPGEGPVVNDGPLTTDRPSAIGVESDSQDLDDAPEPITQTGHTVLVGYGRVGRVAAEALQPTGKLVLIEDSDHAVAAARAKDIEVVVGNAASVDVLKLANLGAAEALMIAIPNGFEAGTVVEQGRKLNPAVRIIARAHSDEEVEHLTRHGADTVIMGEREIAVGMLAWLNGGRADDGLQPRHAAAAEPVVEARLAPTENILQQAATAPLVAGAEPVLGDFEAATLQSDPAAEAPDAEPLAATLHGETLEPDFMETEPQPELLDDSLTDVDAPDAFAEAVGEADAAAAPESPRLVPEPVLPVAEPMPAASDAEPAVSTAAPLTDSAPAAPPVEPPHAAPLSGSPDLVLPPANVDDTDASEHGVALPTPEAAEPLLPAAEPVVPAAPVEVVPEPRDALPSLDDLPPETEPTESAGEERPSPVPPVTPEPRG
ncbi:MAG: sodium:proton antiporter [Devosia sp.]|jgi:CPA2 family monovalent cation:H+ antiporter-2|nr:sodium:proton antiporter [Devosia sp.]